MNISLSRLSRCKNFFDLNMVLHIVIDSKVEWDKMKNNMTRERRIWSVCSSCNESTAVANESFLSLNASGWSIDHTDLLARLSITACRTVKVVGWSSLNCLKLTDRPCNKMWPKCPRFYSTRNLHGVISSTIIYHLIKRNSLLALGYANLWDMAGRRSKEKFLERNLEMSSGVQLRRNL